MVRTSLVGFFALALCTVGCGDDDGGGEGGSSSTGSDTGTGTDTGNGTGTDTGVACPPMPPLAASSCPDRSLDCDYPDADCSPHFFCEEDVSGLAWQERAPDPGAPCPTPGQACYYLSVTEDASGLDVDSRQNAVCTTDDGWAISGGGCFNGCTDCPAELPGPTDDCQLATGAEFSHCLYPIEQGCGVQAAKITCPDGLFVVDAPSCN